MAYLPASRIAGPDHDVGTLLNLGCFRHAAGGRRRSATWSTGRLACGRKIERLTAL